MATLHPHSYSQQGCKSRAYSQAGSCIVQPRRVWHRMQRSDHSGPHGCSQPIEGHPTATCVLRRPCNRSCTHLAAYREDFSDPRLAGGNPRWWEELEDQDSDTNCALTPEEVDERVEEAAAFISVLDDVTPLNPRAYNAFAEVWSRISRIPPHARWRLIQEIDSGAIRGLWRASMARYVLPDDQAMQLLSGFTVLNDFPDQPGQVVTYEGCAERWTFKSAASKFSIDGAMQSRYPRSAPWLKPNQGSMQTTRKQFSQHFFLHPRTGVLHSRLVLKEFDLFGLFPVPIYCRVRPILTLTPLESDAGADMTFDYRVIRDELDLQVGIEAVDPDVQGSDVQGGAGAAEQAVERERMVQEALEHVLLQPSDLPDARWPKPSAGMDTSPFSQTERDFVRVIGPGVYVGCAYERDASGRTNKDACVHFLLARREP